MQGSEAVEWNMALVATHLRTKIKYCFFDLHNNSHKSDLRIFHVCMIDSTNIKLTRLQLLNPFSYPG